MPDLFPDRGYSAVQADKLAAAYARLAEAGESVAVHRLRKEAGVALKAAQSWLAANTTNDAAVPDVPAEELAGILQPLWVKAFTLAAETVDEAAEKIKAGLQEQVDTEVERAEAAEERVSELVAIVERLTDELAEAQKNLTAADDVRSQLAAATARAEAAEDRAQHSEARADQQMVMLGELIRKSNTAETDD